MTATTGPGTDPHPEVSEISDLTEGLLSPVRSATVREHLADCALCEDVLLSLQEVSSLLGALPELGQIPADVAGRIDAALATEAHREALVPNQRVPRGTSSVEHLHDHRHRRRSAMLAAASVAAVVLFGGVLYEAASGGTDAADKASASDAKKADSGSTDDDAVAAQVRRLLDRPPVDIAGRTGDGLPSKDADSPLQSSSGTAGADRVEGAIVVPPCVLLATQRSQPPMATERELFHGADSYLVVLPHPGDTSLVDAYVVTADCSASSPGTVLFQSSYPR